MKKIVILGLTACMAAFTSQAGRGQHALQSNGKQYHAENMAANKATGTVSTVLFPASFGSGSPCASTISVYGDTSVGYFAGVDKFGDNELLMRYTLSDYGLTTPASVDTAYGFFGFKYKSGNGNVRAKIYAADGTGAPAALLGTSGDISVAAVDTTGKATKFIFSSPISLTTKTFFVSIDISSLYATHDTVALFSTDNSCSTTKPLAAWTKESDNNFYAYADSLNNWGFSLDMGIFAHLTATPLAVPNTAISAMQMTAYPQPATSQVYIDFTGNQNGLVQLDLMDITGKLITENSINTVIGQHYKVPFDVSNLTPGLYFTQVVSGTEKGMIKVMVGH